MRDCFVASADSTIGSTVHIAITGATRTQHTLAATVVGATEEPLVSPMGASILPNDALADALFNAQNIGIPQS